MTAARRTLLTAALALLACLAAVPVASAYWLNSGTGSTIALTGTLPGGLTPTASAAGTTVTVNVNQVSVVGQFVGVLGGGYTIKRYPAAGGASATPGGTCGASVTGPASVLTCTETNTPRGDWKYTVTPTLFQWTTTESPTSATVVVAPDAATALSATAAAGAAINLSWTAGGGATGYNVYRRTTAGSYNFSSPVNGSTPVSGTTYTDTTAVSGTSYNYVVRSVVTGSASQQIESANSNESAAVTADGAGPTGVTLSAVTTPTSGTVVMNGTASDAISGVANVIFEYKPSAGSTWTTVCTDPSSPYSCSFDTSSVADGLYDFRVRALDNVGNQTISAVQTNRLIDNTAPTASATNPGAYVRGTISLGGTASDGGSGVASLVLEGRAVGAGAWTTVCSSTSSPLVCSYDTTGIADGPYEVQLTAVDNAGNQTTTPTITPIVVDNTAPSITINTPPANFGGVVTLSSVASDATSGLATVQYEYKLSSGSTWSNACSSSSTPWSCSFNSASVADGLYDFRAIATDQSGNQTTSAASTGRRVDNTAPSGVTITAPATPITGTITINAGTPTDTGSGVASVAIQYSPAGAASWTSVCADATAPYSCSFNSTLVADGLYDFRAFATDNAGNTAASATVTNRRVDNTGPVVALTNPGSPVRGTLALSATATDPSGVASVAFQYKLSAGATWTTISTDTTSPYTASFNTSALNGTYDIRALATDAIGLQSNSTITGIVIDNIAPTGTDIQTANGGGATRTPDAGDTITYTYSEPMLATSILAGWSGASTAVTMRFTNGAPDTMTVWNAANSAQLPLGSVTLSNTTVTASATFNATMVMSGNTVIVTLGTQTSGTVARSNANFRMVWTPSAAATDLAGNPTSTTAVNEGGANDREF